MQVLKRIWRDDAGFIVSAELVLVATILVIGVMVGLNAVRNSVVNELADVSKAVDNLNQGLVVGGVQGHAAAVAGWQFADNSDYCNVDPVDRVACTAAGIKNQNIAPTFEGDGPPATRW